MHRRDISWGAPTVTEHVIEDDYELVVGFVPEFDAEILVTLWADGTRQVATRPGNGQTQLTWSAPIDLPARTT